MADHIGSKVNIPGTRGYGILRYYGGIQGKPGKFGGIELQGPIAALRGKNSGSVEGVSYFEVETPMTGLFLPWDRLLTSNPQLDTKSKSIPKAPGAKRLSSVNTSSSLLSDRRSSTASPTTSRTSTPSPNVTQQIQVPKRNGLFEITRSAYSSSTNIEQELQEVKAKYLSTQTEMQQKIAILNELQSTVNEIHPLLEEYETSLAEKDKKLFKQKQDFELAREEWRQSMDVMTANQQENEEYYVQQIQMLKQSVHDVDQKVDNNETVRSLEAEIEQLKAQLKANDVKELKVNDKLVDSDLSKLTEELNKKNELIIELENKLKNPSDIQDKDATEKDDMIDILKEQLLELTETNTRDKAEIESLKNDLVNNKGEKLDSITNKDLVQANESTIFEKDKEIEKLKQELAKSKATASTTNDEELFITILKQEMEITKLKEQIEEMNSSTSDKEGDSESLGEVATLKEEISKLKQQLENTKTPEADDELSEVKTELANTKKSVKEQELLIEELKLKNDSVVQEKEKEINILNEEYRKTNSASSDEDTNELKQKLSLLIKEKEELRAKTDQFDKDKVEIETEHEKKRDLLIKEHELKIKELNKDSNSKAIDDESSQVKELKDEIEQLKTKSIPVDEYNKLEESHEKLKHVHLEMLKKGPATTASPDLKQLESELETIKEDNERLRVELELAKDVDLDEQVKSLTKENIAIKEAMAEADQTTLVEQLQRQVGKLSMAMKDGADVTLTKQVDTLTKEVQQLKSENDSLLTTERKLEFMTKENRKLKESIVQDSKSKSIPSDEIEQLHIQIEGLSKELHSMQEMNGQLHKELSSKQKELDSIHKKVPDQSKLDDYNNTIEELKHELEMRPTFEELVELQNSIDELDSLHKTEFDSKEQEIVKLNKEIEKLQGKLINTTALHEDKENITPIPETINNTKSVSAPNTLPIYNPPVKLDPSTGKDDWCGLCERDGHSSINCPYENDIF